MSIRREGSKKGTWQKKEVYVVKRSRIVKKKNELQNIEEKIEVTLLGHGNSLQDCISSSDPLHSLPPCCGGGLVQVRDRFRVPPPHVTLHCDHAFQSVHLPSTVKKSGVDVKGMNPCCEQLDLKHGVIYQLCFVRISLNKSQSISVTSEKRKVIHHLRWPKTKFW